MSSFYTSGSFGDQVFSPSLLNGAGEPGAIDGGLSRGPLQPRFTATVWFKSTTTTAQNSHVVISADRGDGARMSWIQVSDNAVNPPSTCSDNGNTCTSNANCTAGVADCLPDGRSGLSVSFYDYRVPANVLDCGGGQDTEGKCFVFATLASNLDRSTWHRIDFEMEFYAGEANDVVRVSVDGGPQFRGTSWEDYFRNNQNPPFTSPPTVDSLLFRAGGAKEGNQGEGFYFDDLTFASTAASCSGARYVATGGDDTFNDCRDSGAPCATIQHAIDSACPGETINVAAGTYSENVVVDKAVTLAGAGQGLSTIVPAVSNPTPLGCGGSLCGGAASNIILVQADNVTIQDFTLDGNNPNINSGVVVGGADIDARNGIITNFLAGDVHNLSVYRTTVQNVYLRGIYSTSAVGSSTNTFSFQDNTVQNVQGDYPSIGMFAFAASGDMIHNTVSDANDAISANWSLGINFINNTVSNSGSGVHTDNSGGSGSNFADVIQGNTISNCMPGGYGIFTFAPYVSPSVRSNTITNCDVGLAASGGGGVNTAFADNVVDGTNKPGSVGAYVTTSQFGFGSANVSATFTGNLIENTTDGFQLQDKTCWNGTDGTDSTNGCKVNADCAAGETCTLGFTLTVTATCNRIAGNGTGVLPEALSTPALVTFNSDIISGNGTGIDGSALPAGPPLGAQNNYWGCASGPGTAGCDSVVGNVAALPAVASAPFCAFCSVDGECNDGLACNGTESCNQGTSTCQATAPPNCASFNDVCHTGTCTEPSGNCVATPKPDGTSCSSGGATCQSGVCTGSTGSLIVASARLKKNTARNPKFNNGSVFVQAVVIDEDTGGTLPDNLTNTNNPVTLDAQDGSGTFYSPQPVVRLTHCTKNSAATRVTCKGDPGLKTTATFAKIRYFGHPYGEVWRMTVSRTGLGTGTSVPSGTIHVTLHQGPVDRSDSPSDCSTAGNTRICHHTSP